MYQQVEMTIINIYAPNRGAARYTSQILTRIKRHIDKNTLIVGDLNTPLSATDRSFKQKINKETRFLNDTLDQMDLIDTYRTLHPRATEYVSEVSQAEKNNYNLHVEYKE